MGQISKETGFSKTTVFNVVHEWTLAVAVTDLDEIRFFLSELKKSGITIQQCVRGFRIEQILHKFKLNDEFDEWIDDEKTSNTVESTGLDLSFNQPELNTNNASSLYDENKEGLVSIGYQGKNKIGITYSITDFINRVYKNCNTHGISPEIIVKWLLDLFEFYALTDKKQTLDNMEVHSYQFKEDKDNADDIEKISEGFDTGEDEVIPFVSKVSFFLTQKKKHIRNLDNIKKSIISEIYELTAKKNDLISEFNSVVHKKKSVFSYFNWYESLKKELYDRYKIILENNIDNMVNVIYDFNNFKFDVFKIISEYNEIKSLISTKNQLQQQIDFDRSIKSKLQDEIDTLDEQANYYTQTIKTYEELFKIGCGLKELKKLTNIIYESALANNFVVRDSVKEFFKNVEDQYDDKLGYEKTINELRVEMEKMKLQVPEYKYYLRLQGIVSPILVHLNSSGVTNEDIIEINHLVGEFKDSDFLSDPTKQNKSIVVTGRNESEKKIKYWTLFTNRLRNLKNLNAEISKQITKIDHLNEQITKLGGKKEELESNYLSVVNTLMESICESYKFLVNIKMLDNRTTLNPVIIVIFYEFDSSNGGENNKSDCGQR